MTGRKATRLALMLLGALMIVAAVAVSTQSTSGSPIIISHTYTLNADFDEGTLLSVNHDAPNINQLQLNTTTSPFPFVNIAASGRGTIVRIDVDDGTILGEYLTAPDGMGRNPSRTTVDLLGNVWFGNRDESGVSGGSNKGSVARAGLVIGGTRSDSAGMPNPTGQYLSPPFQYNTCVDRDGDGLIKTSRGLGDILSWTNAGGADTHGGVTTAEDECIINYTRVTGTNTRTVAVDANNDLWVGGADSDHEKLDGVTGAPVPGTQFNLGCGGYGGLIDGNGVLWSARFGLNPPLRFDTTTMTGACLGPTRGDYGFGIDPQTGHIWHTFLSGNAVAELGADGTVLNTFGHGESNAQGVAVDGVGNVWVAHSLLGPSTTVGHLRTDGTFVGNVPLPAGAGPTGVAVDTNGKIWVANYSTDNAMRIDPNAGPIGGGGFPVGAVDLTVDLDAAGGIPASPYNYSDMTGFVVIGSTAPQGTWTVIFDSQQAATEWGTISWNTQNASPCPASPAAREPAGTSLTVRARSAATQAGLGAASYINATNGADVSPPNGRFMQIEAKLAPNDAGVSPILCDLTVQGIYEPPTPVIESTPTPTERPVGGISYDPAISAAPIEAEPSSSSDAWLLTDGLAIAAASAIALGSSAWYVRRRRMR